MQATQPRCVRVSIEVPDPISQLGIVSYLDSSPDTMVLPADQRHDADVVVVAADRLDPQVLATLRQNAHVCRRPTVLVTNELKNPGLLAIVEFGVVAVLPRTAATGERLLNCVHAAASGSGMLPPELVGELLRDIERLQRQVLGPLGLNTAGLNHREIDVLRLMSEGFENAEIATKLSYSDRTVKNIVHGLTTRLDLRGRAHAVAYAIRIGII